MAERVRKGSKSLWNILTDKPGPEHRVHLLSKNPLRGNAHSCSLNVHCTTSSVQATVGCKFHLKAHCNRYRSECTRHKEIPSPSSNIDVLATNSSERDTKKADFDWVFHWTHYRIECDQYRDLYTPPNQKIQNLNFFFREEIGKSRLGFPVRIRSYSNFRTKLNPKIY